MGKQGRQSMIGKAIKAIKSINKYTFSTYILFGFIFLHFARQMLQIKNSGWYVGQVNLYGDLVFHLGLIGKFMQNESINFSNPYFFSDKPNYPIFADFVTAQIAKITSIDFSLFIVTFILGLIIIYVTTNFVKIFVNNDKVIFLALLIFFFNGGFGFYYFFQDLLNSQKPFFEFIFNLPNEYTDIKEKGYWWINTYLAYFLPQRGFLFAFPITLTALSLLYVGFKKSKSYLFFIAAVLAGLLPIVQIHSLFIIFLISLYFSLLTIISSKFEKKVILNWVIFALLTTIIALPIFSTISSLENPFEFSRFKIGWTNEENLIWFWFKNLGIFAPLLVASLIWLYYKRKSLFRLYLPFLLIFIISNLFIFQPWDFDNSKLLIYWYFPSCIIVAYFLYDKFLSENFLRKTLGVFIVLSTIFSGGLDIFRTFTPVSNYQIFTTSDLAVADSVKNLTPKNALFITASNHNHPIPAIAGRSTLVGFHGWLWSHGLPYENLAQDVKKIYLGGQEAEKQISKYKINYVTIGPNERQEFAINENYFKKLPKINLNGGWALYDVSSLWTDSSRQN